MQNLLLILSLIIVGNKCNAQNDTIYYIIEEYLFWDVDTNKIFQHNNDFPRKLIDHSKSEQINGCWIFYDLMGEEIGSQSGLHLYTFPMKKYYILNNDTFNINKTNWDILKLDIDFIPRFKMSPFDYIIAIENNQFRGYGFKSGHYKSTYTQVLQPFEVQYGKYKEGKKSGTWLIYTSTKKLYKKLKYENGQLQLIELYTDEGSKIRRAVRENDRFKLEIYNFKDGTVLEKKIVGEELIFLIEIL